MLIVEKTLGKTWGRGRGEKGKNNTKKKRSAIKPLTSITGGRKKGGGGGWGVKFKKKKKNKNTT